MSSHESQEHYQDYDGANPGTSNVSDQAKENQLHQRKQKYLTEAEVKKGVSAGVKDVETHRRLSISSESDNSSIDEKYSIPSITSSIEDQLTCRGRMQVILHSHYFHIVVIALVVLDAFIVLFELLLDVGAFGNVQCIGEGLIEQAEFCHFDSGSRDECFPPANLILEGINISVPPDETPGLSGICGCRFRDAKLVCAPEEDSHGVNPALVLHYISICILSIFMVEVGLKLIAFRLKYFTHKFDVFDGIVVVISWVLDIASLVEETAFEAIALLIILRLWRVVRIVNGAVLSSKARSDAQLHQVRQKARKVIHALHKAQARLKLSQDERDKMKKLLEDSGIPVPESEKLLLLNEQQDPDSDLPHEE